MTREDIIRMAWEAGFQVLLPQDHVDGTGGVYVVEDEIAGMLERFAALVAASERKSFAEECEQLAKHAKETGDMNGMAAALALAITIRARGE